MSSYESIIERAKFLAMSPEAVASLIAQTSEQKSDRKWLRALDSELEVALKARREPLIDLALCRYGQERTVLRSMFEGSEPDGPLRLAVLCNKKIGSDWGGGLPQVMFDNNIEAADWLAVASSLEIAALFENPTLDDEFLSNVLNQKSPWDRLPNEQLSHIVRVLCGNERMQRAYETDYLDGYADHRYHAVFSAAWRLAERMPTTTRWAEVLGRLFGVLQPVPHAVEVPLTVAQRWSPSKADVGSDNAREVDVTYGVLSGYQLVRKGLAKIVLIREPTLLAQLLQSDDPALRAAAYAHADLTPEQINAGREKDGSFMIHHALENPLLWRSNVRREALRAAAWAAEDDSMLAVNIFNGALRKQLRNHPEWFRDDENAREALDQKTSATKSDITNLKVEIEKHSGRSDLDAISGAVKSIEKKVGWVLSISVAVIASLILKSLN